MIIWINGPFGAGKTTVTKQLLKTGPSLVVFDTEHVGYLLQGAMQQRIPVADFQDWRSWRRLLVATLTEVGAELDCDSSYLRRSWSSGTGTRSQSACRRPVWHCARSHWMSTPQSTSVGSTPIRSKPRLSAGDTNDALAMSTSVVPSGAT